MRNKKLIQLITLLLGTDWDTELPEILKQNHEEIMSKMDELNAKFEAMEQAVLGAVTSEAEQIKQAIEKAKSTGSEADFDAITAKVDSLQSRLVNAVSGLVEDEDEPTEDPEVGVFPVL